MEQRLALGAGIMFRDALEGVPDHNVGIRKFFYRKITFEHAAIDTEAFDAGFEVRLQNCGELCG